MKLKNAINICFCNSLKEVLKDSDKKLKVLSIPMVFDIGNLHELENFKVQKYLGYSNDDFVEIQKNLRKVNKIINSSKVKDIVVWYSEDSNDYCGMLYFFHKLRENKDKNIYLINCSQKLFSKNSIIEIKKTSEIRKEFIPLIIKKAKKISYMDKQKYINEFERNFDKPGAIRVYYNNKILEVSYLKLSELVYKHLKIGKSIYLNKFLIEDRFSFSHNVIFFIIKGLMDSKRIEVKKDIIIKKN